MDHSATDPGLAPQVLTTIVVPCRNEALNILPLIAEIAAAMAGQGAFEIIVVDDGSDDGMAARLEAARGDWPMLRVLRHDRSGGQSAAIHSGVLAARGALICMLDGDGQNPPAELPRLIAALRAPGAAPIGLVAGQRVGRKDTLARRLASRFANGLRSRVLKDGTRDTGCGLKAFRRDAYLALPYFDHMHRYLPALFARDGWQIAHVDVTHRPRGAGRSHYSNLQRGLVGVVDLMAVAWLLHRRKKVRATEISPIAGPVTERQP
ncbi:glycosyl transferase family 2 [Rhodobacter viridis]|uniref:Glycosyl transferase family 2 n=1 Tax=Rhodobacter viridis TaxID=1054202 RepID=A0A318U889_9RHOB|nr:glycosyltransferase family 2 protein [Rhodobacter viridis]PYF08199.1 glycosyl transferase family 2 [Rhodobacter viridis]